MSPERPAMTPIAGLGARPPTSGGPGTPRSTGVGVGVAVGWGVAVGLGVRRAGVGAGVGVGSGNIFTLPLMPCCQWTMHTYSYVPGFVNVSE